MPFRFNPVIRYACLAATIVVAGVLLYESTQARGSPGVPDLTTNEAYVGHFAIYAAMTLSALAAIGRRSIFGMIIVVELAISLGIAMEIFQGHVPGRTPSMGDVVADATGAVLGALAYAVLLRVYDSLTPQPTKL